MTIVCVKCQTDNPNDSKFCKDCGQSLEIDLLETKAFDTTTEVPFSDSTFTGRYEIVEKLGEGGMGIVYRVTDPLNPERSVALKSIRRNRIQSELIGRFKAEFRVLTSLQHPNVAAAYDFESLPGSEDYFFTMEYIKGRDIFQATEGLDWQQIVSQEQTYYNHLDIRHFL